TNVFNSTKMREAGDYSKEIMKCGLTGLVQINKGKMKHEVKNMDMLYIDYIKNNSGWKIVFYDLKILYYTVVAVFQAKGL
ncbi:sugar transferase, partial [Patescibacteria group bacterium]|nr:sugar transferase [Patescibacteria group bacterium]